MTRNEFRKELAKRTKTSYKLAGVFIDAYEDIILDTLAEGGNVALTGFGVFETVDRPPKPANNMQTGEKIIIPERKAFRFRIGTFIKEAIAELNGEIDYQVL